MLPNLRISGIAIQNLTAHSPGHESSETIHETASAI